MIYYSIIFHLLSTVNLIISFFNIVEIKGFETPYLGKYLLNSHKDNLLSQFLNIIPKNIFIKIYQMNIHYSCYTKQKTLIATYLLIQ